MDYVKFDQEKVIGISEPKIYDRYKCCILERQREGIAIAKEQCKHKIKVDENAFKAEYTK